MGAAVLNHQLTYRGVIARLAELADLAGFLTVADLPALETEEVAAALVEHPSAFNDALAEIDTTREVIISLLVYRKASRDYQHALIGIALMAAISDHLRPIIWKDVEARRETIRRNRAIEQDGARTEERAAVRQGALS